MTFVTKLTLQSGDRAALDGTVEDIRSLARRKGAELKGPHAEAPRELRIPLYRRLDGDEARRYPRWKYSVYTRRIELTGREDLLRDILDRGFPESVHVEAAVEQVRPMGQGRR